MRTKLALLMLIAVFGLTWVLGEAPDQRADLTFHYPNMETLDPQRTRAAFDVRCAYALYQGLLTFNPYTFVAIPGVAERWEISDDKRTYTFYLREEARWSNGDPVTAHDFKETWYQGLLPGIAPPYVEFFYHFKGAKAFSQWCMNSLEEIRDLETQAEKMAAARQRWKTSREKFNEMVGIHVAGPRKLVVELERPLPYFLDLVASWPLFPLHVKSLQKQMSISTSNYMILRDWTWTQPQTMITNGPYTMARWRFKRDILLEANPYFWDAESVKSKTVRLVNIKQDNTAYYAYAQGQLDVLYETVVNFRPDIVEAARRGERNDVHEASMFGTYYYGFNCAEKLKDGRDNPVGNPLVRKALTMSVDREALVRDVTRMYQKPTDVFIPRGSIPGYESPTGLPYDPEAARRVLAEAGYPDGKGLPTIEVIYNTEGAHQLQAQAIAAMWEKNLGISVALKAQEWKVYLSTRRTGGYMVARHGWFGDYGDPTTFLDMYTSKSGMNDFGMRDPKYDAMMQRAAEETDSEKRMELLREAERYMLTEAVPMLPLYEYKVVHLWDPDKVSGVSMHPRGLQMFHLWEVKR